MITHAGTVQHVAVLIPRQLFSETPTNVVKNR